MPKEKSKGVPAPYIVNGRLLCAEYARAELAAGKKMGREYQVRIAPEGSECEASAAAASAKKKK